MNDCHFIGWTRSGEKRGTVLRYHFKHICNTITSFSGGGYMQGQEYGHV